MPKIVDYPLFPFEKVLELANAVDYLGGSCTIQDCAHRLKKKLSGGFGVLISSAIKHDLIGRKGDRLSVTDLYKKIKFSYNPAEKADCQRISFLHPVLYRKIYDRFKGKELPLPMLDKLLIREFQVDEKVSEKIAGFFVDGLKKLHMIKDGKLLTNNEYPALVNRDEPIQASLPLSIQEEPARIHESLSDDNDINLKIKQLEDIKSGKFMLSIQGEGIDSTIVLETGEDFQIVEAILAKIKRKLL